MGDTTFFSKALGFNRNIPFKNIKHRELNNGDACKSYPC